MLELNYLDSSGHNNNMWYAYAPKGGCRSNSSNSAIEFADVSCLSFLTQSPGNCLALHQNNHGIAQTTMRKLLLLFPQGLGMMCLGRSDITECWQCAQGAAILELQTHSFCLRDLEEVQRFISLGRRSSSRKHKYAADSLVQAIRNIPLVKRQTLQSLSYHANIPRSTLHNYLRRGLLKRATSSIKSALKQANIQRRLNYCMAKVEADRNVKDLM